VAILSSLLSLKYLHGDRRGPWIWIFYCKKNKMVEQASLVARAPKNRVFGCDDIFYGISESSEF
jgi:hypothetical protein